MKIVKVAIPDAFLWIYLQLGPNLKQPLRERRQCTHDVTIFDLDVKSFDLDVHSFNNALGVLFLHKIHV